MGSTRITLIIITLDPVDTFLMQLQARQKTTAAPSSTEGGGQEQVNAQLMQVSLPYACPLAGRLKHFLPAWHKITADHNILDILEHCHLEFNTPVCQTHVRPEINYDQTEKMADREINHLQKLGVIEPACHSSGEFISSIFVRKKKSGKYRMILNLKGLNRHIEYHHFKMDTLWSAVRLMTPQCYMTSLDLKDAYYSVPIADEHRKYLRFYQKGQLFQYTCLPNGLFSAPRYFTKILKPVYSTLRKRGHLNVGYIDDSYLQGSNESECALNVADTRALFTDVGFVISEEKSVTTPTQLIVFLRFILDSRLMHITLTLEKKEKLKDMCSTLLSKPVITINKLSLNYW